MAYDPLVTPIDVILLQGRRSPGIATVTGAGMPRKWDPLKGYGLSGAFSVYKGQELATWKVTLDLVTEQDWIDWEAWRQLLNPPAPTPQSKGLDIWHPWLAAYNIRACVVTGVSQPEEGELGIWRVEIAFLEFRAPKRALVKPESAATKTGAPESLAEKNYVAAANHVTDQLRELGQP